MRKGIEWPFCLLRKVPFANLSRSCCGRWICNGGGVGGKSLITIIQRPGLSAKPRHVAVLPNGAPCLYDGPCLIPVPLIACPPRHHLEVERLLSRPLVDIAPCTGDLRELLVCQATSQLGLGAGDKTPQNGRPLFNILLRHSLRIKQLNDYDEALSVQ